MVWVLYLDEALALVVDLAEAELKEALESLAAGQGADMEADAKVGPSYAALNPPPELSQLLRDLGLWEQRDEIARHGVASVLDMQFLAESDAPLRGASQAASGVDDRILQ